MAEITAGLVKELREHTGAGNDGVQEGADRGRRRPEQGRGAAAHQERHQGEQGGGPHRRRRRDRRVTCRPTASSARWSKSTARPTSSRRTTISRVRRSRWPSSSPTQQPDGRRGAVRARPLDGRRSKRGARRWCRRSARTCRSAASGACRPRASSRLYLHGVEDRRAGGLRGAGRGSARTSRCTSRSPSRALSQDRGAGGHRRSASARSSSRAAKESGKPAEHRREDGRRRACNKFLGEVTLLGQPFVKDDKQTVEKLLTAKKAKVHALRASSSSARASRRRRAISPPK